VQKQIKFGEANQILLSYHKHNMDVANISYHQFDLIAKHLAQVFFISLTNQRLKCKIQHTASLQNLSQLKVLYTEIRVLITMIYRRIFFHSPVFLCESY